GQLFGVNPRNAGGELVAGKAVCRIDGGAREAGKRLIGDDHGFGEGRGQIVHGGREPIGRQQVAAAGQQGGGKGNAEGVAIPAQIDDRSARRQAGRQRVGAPEKGGQADALAVVQHDRRVERSRSQRE